MKLSGSQKLALLEMQRLYEELHYQYCEEISSLENDEERDEKYQEADENLAVFKRLIDTI